MAARVSLLLVMGLPGAGKTTFCSHLRERLSAGMEVLHVDFDERLGGAEEERWKAAREAVVAWIRRTVVHRRDGGEELLLLLDDNFYYDSMRRPLWALAKDLNCGFGCLEVTTPLQRCLDNDAARVAPVGEEVIRRMAGRIEWPHLRDSPEFCFVLPDPYRPDWDAVVAFIADRHSRPLSRDAEEVEERRLAEARRESRRNVMHQADLFLRALIGEQMRTAGAAASRARSRSLAEAKRSVLEAVRSDPDLPLDVTQAEDRHRLEALLRRRFSALLPS